MKKTRSAIRIPMPLRYLINLVLILALWFVLYTLIQNGTITNYWSGILITVGINIILATSLNVATGYLGQLPLGHAGFMAVGAYAGGIFMKAVPVQELLKSGNTGAAIPYILLALLISAVVAGIFGILIGIPALRLRGDYLAIITLGFGEIIRVILTNIDSVIGKDFTYGAAGLKRIPKYSSFTLVFICVVVSCYIIHTIMKSRHGRAILSIREASSWVACFPMPTWHGATTSAGVTSTSASWFRPAWAAWYSRVRRPCSTTTVFPRFRP